ncbi:MAG: hypothetical protein ACLQPD_20750 [Desulfomonilaceae bacterium]
MNQPSETSEKLSAREKTEMDAKEFHRGYNWRMVSGSPTGTLSVARTGSKRTARARIIDVNEISLEPEDFVTTHRLIHDKPVAAPAPSCPESDEAAPPCSESDEPPERTKTGGVAKLLLLLLASLTAAIIVPRLLPSGYSGVKLLPFYEDSSKFSAPAGSGNWLDERSLAPRFISEPIDPALMSSKGSFEEMRPAAQNCLPVDPRSGFVPGNAAAEHSPSAMPQGSSMISTALASRRLQEIELRLRECELIIQLLDSGKGAFSGFVPENNITGISSLARFQEKIVQLEINKQALAVRFAPTSKEIQAIDLEIQGVKAAMRDCVEANLRFFQKGRQQLLDQKEGKKGPTGMNNKGQQPQSLEPSLLGRCWSFLSDGIDAVVNQLVGTGKSIASRASKLGNKLISNASTYVDRNPKVSGKAENDWSRLAGSGHIRHPETRINSGRAEKARNVFPSSRSGQRGVNAAPSPGAEAGISDSTGARRRLWQSLRDNDTSCERQ